MTNRYDRWSAVELTEEVAELDARVEQLDAAVSRATAAQLAAEVRVKELETLVLEFWRADCEGQGMSQGEKEGQARYDVAVRALLVAGSKLHGTNR